MKLALPVSLLVLSAGFAVAAVYELAAPLDPVTADAPRRASVLAAALPDTAAYVRPSPEQFADIDARPIFNPTRKPLPDSAAAGTGATSPSDLSLVGVMMSSDRSIALLKSKSTSLTTSVAVGSVIDGWRVVRIEPTMVSLGGSSGVLAVPLESPGSESPTAPLPATEPAAQAIATAPIDHVSSAVVTAATQKPVASIAAPATISDTSPKPALSVHAGDGTIAPEALKGAPRDPRTGEPTL